MYLILLISAILLSCAAGDRPDVTSNSANPEGATTEPTQKNTEVPQVPTPPTTPLSPNSAPSPTSQQPSLTPPPAPACPSAPTLFFDPRIQACTSLSLWLNHEDSSNVSCTIRHLTDLSTGLNPDWTDSQKQYVANLFTSPENCEVTDGVCGSLASYATHACIDDDVENVFVLMVFRYLNSRDIEYRVVNIPKN